MDNNKRKKRKAEKAMRMQRLRYMKPQATITNYGKAGQVEYMAVAIHRDSELVEARYFNACDYPNGYEMCEDAVSFARGHGIARVAFVEELHKPDGKRTCRITGKEPEVVN